MSSSGESRPVPDQTLHELLLGQWLLPAIVTANDLGLLSAIGTRSRPAESVAAELQLDAKGVAVVCDLLCNLELLSKSANGYRLTRLARAYLIPGVPEYWGPLLATYRSTPQCEKVVDALRRGRGLLASDGQTYTRMWESGNMSVQAALEFTPRMHPLSLPSFRYLVRSGLFDGVRSVLDIGGGSGALGVALAERGLDLDYTLLDLPPVCGMAETYLSEHPAFRWSLRPGNFFKDPWPGDQDVVFFGNIFHDWPPEIGERLAESAFRALAHGGRICLHEMLLDEDKTSPRVPLLFSLLMFVNHSAQQFTERELFELLAARGFHHPRRRQSLGHYSIVIAEK